MSEEKQQITDTIDKVQEVVDLFYQQKDSEAFEKFTAALDSMSIAINNLAVYKSLNETFELDEEKLCDILKEAMNALESQDRVLMADILQYDFIEYINELLEEMD